MPFEIFITSAVWFVEQPRRVIARDSVKRSVVVRPFKTAFQTFFNPTARVFHGAVDSLANHGSIVAAVVIRPFLDFAFSEVLIQVFGF